jgi:antitoxin ParD1/3/4
MPTMNISLPEQMKDFVEQQVSTRGYSSASEYVRELVRADQKLKAKEQLESLMLDSLRSGNPIEVTPRMWDDLRGTLRKQAKARKPAK